MRQTPLVVLLAVLALVAVTPRSAAASTLGPERLKLHYFSEDPPGEGAAVRAPSALQRVGFFSLGVVASLASFALVSPVVSGLGLESPTAGIVGAALVLGVSAVAHYGLAVLLGIPVSIPTVLIGVVGGAGAGILAVVGVVALSEPQEGLGALGTVLLALAAGALAYGIVSPLLVLIDPFGFARVTPSARAQAHALAKGPSRSPPTHDWVTVPLLARSF